MNIPVSASTDNENLANSIFKCFYYLKRVYSFLMRLDVPAKPDFAFNFAAVATTPVNAWEIKLFNSSSRVSCKKNLISLIHRKCWQGFFFIQEFLKFK